MLGAWDTRSDRPRRGARDRLTLMPVCRCAACSSGAVISLARKPMSPLPRAGARGRRHHGRRRHPAVAADGGGPRRRGGDRHRRRGLDWHRLVKISVFGAAGAMTTERGRVALLIGVVAFPGAFLAKLIVERLPVHVHTAMLDVVVHCSAALMILARSDDRLHVFSGVTAISPLAASTTGSNRRCRRSAGRKSCRGRRAG